MRYDQGSATYGTRTTAGTPRHIHWHAQVRIYSRSLCVFLPLLLIVDTH
uniref:Uncharacterized protein n=1 Tax=Lepeophtheirus salmonis TaxID=72036 RepID=A0A0K2UTL0_LEPSM